MSDNFAYVVPTGLREHSAHMLEERQTQKRLFYRKENFNIETFIFRLIQE